MIFKSLLIIFAIFSSFADKIPLNNCKCDGFLAVSPRNEIKFDKNPFEAFFDHPDVTGRRVYVVGSLGETQVLNEIILKELYTNVSEEKI